MNKLFIVKGKMNKKIKLVLFFLGVAIFIILILRMPFKESLAQIARANFLTIAIGALFYLVVIFIRSFKWFLLTKKTNDRVQYKEILPIYLVNSLMGNITPLKSGELASVFLFSKYFKIPRAQGLSIIIFDRFFEIFVFALLFILSILYIITSEVKNNITIFSFEKIIVIFTALVFFITLLIFSNKTGSKIIRSFDFLKKYSPCNKILNFIEREFLLFHAAFSLFKNKRNYFLIFFLTLLAWISEIVSFYFVFNSVCPIPFLQITSIQLITVGASIVALIPAGIGIGELSYIFLLGLFDHPAYIVFGAILTCRIVITGLLFASGLLGLLLIKESRWKEYKSLEYSK